MNKFKLYRNLTLQWEILDALKEPSSAERARKLRIGCLLLLLESMRQNGEWRVA